jgi:hypothetical protein
MSRIVVFIGKAIRDLFELRGVYCLILIGLVITDGRAEDLVPQDDPRAKFFEEQVRPIFVERCQNVTDRRNKKGDCASIPAKAC